jgi:hypothetical protein
MSKWSKGTKRRSLCHSLKAEGVDRLVQGHARAFGAAAPDSVIWARSLAVLPQGPAGIPGEVVASA